MRQFHMRPQIGELLPNLANFRLPLDETLFEFSKLRLPFKAGSQAAV
jgi:hypothetical protein